MGNGKPALSLIKYKARYTHLFLKTDDAYL